MEEERRDEEDEEGEDVDWEREEEEEEVEEDEESNFVRSPSSARGWEGGGTGATFFSEGVVEGEIEHVEGEPPGDTDVKEFADVVEE